MVRAAIRNKPLTSRKSLKPALNKNRRRKTHAAAFPPQTRKPETRAYSAADLNCAFSVDSPMAVVEAWPPESVLATRSK
jgi:hypothetical protein